MKYHQATYFRRRELGNLFGYVFYKYDAKLVLKILK
jgi:hypothetical protein